MHSRVYAEWFRTLAPVTLVVFVGGSAVLAYGLSVEEAFRAAAGEEEACIIGGTSLFEDADYIAALTAPAVVQVGGMGELSSIELRKRLIRSLIVLFVLYAMFFLVGGDGYAGLAQGFVSVGEIPAGIDKIERR